MSDAEVLRRIASDSALMEIGRKAVEDQLIEWRNDGLFTLRHNGYVIRGYDGSNSSIVRFGPEIGCRTALDAIAKHLEGVA